MTQRPTPSFWNLGWDELNPLQRNAFARTVVGAFAVFMILCAGVYAYSIGWRWERDYIHFYKAGEAARTGGDIYLSGVRGYIYPPLIAVVMIPFSAIDYHWSAVVWTLVNVGMMVGVVWLLARETCERFGAGQAWANDRLLAWVVASAGALALFDKVRAVIQNGQTDTVTMLLIAAGYRSERSRPFLCGFWLGLACAVKYHSLVFLLYFAARGRYRECAGMLTGITLGALAGVPVWGWARNNDYLRRALGGMSDMFHIRTDYGPGVAVHSLDWLQSVSITSGLARIIGHHEHPVLYASSAIAAALAAFGLGWWMYVRNGFALFKGRAGDRWRVGDDPSHAMIVAVEWAGLLAATIIFSPQSVARHFSLMMFPAIIAAPAVLFPRRGAPRWPIVVAWVVMFLSMILPPQAWGRGVYQWRWVAGMGWCSLLYFFAVLWVTLRWVAGSARASNEAPGVGPARDSETSRGDT